MIYCLSLIFSICLFSSNVAMETEKVVKQAKKDEKALFFASEELDAITWKEFKRIPEDQLKSFRQKHPDKEESIKALIKLGIEKQKKYFERIIKENQKIDELYPKLYKGRRYQIYTSFPAPIQWAATLEGSDFFSYVQRCLDAGANINVCEEFAPVVIRAGIIKDSQYLKFLLDKKADPNIVWREFTALMVAALHGHNDNVQLLLNYKADVNWRNSNGYSALTIAIEKKEEEMVQLLLANHAKIRPFDRAVAEESGSEVIKNLIVASNN